MEIGSTVYAEFGKYSTIDVRKGTVVKVSPSGQISADFGRTNYGDGSKIIDRFTRRGDMIGDGSAYYKVCLISEECYLGRVETMKERVATKALKDAVSDYRWRNKAEAIAGAEAILTLANALVE